MAKKEGIFRRIASWFMKRFGRAKIPNDVDQGCAQLRNAESRLEGEIAAIEAENGNANHQKGELNTVREGMDHLGC